MPSKRTGTESTPARTRTSREPRRTAVRGERRRPRTSRSWREQAKSTTILLVTAWVLSVLVFRLVAPPITSLVLVRQVQSLFSPHYGIKDWRWISARHLPPHVLQAVVTSEDARFMKHLGVDLLAVGDALDSAEGKRKLRGASTITMQTVKNIYLWPGRSYIRKILEWMMAPVAGILWGKRRTLELYLNVIEWGDGIYGIDSAAHHYYNKSASLLSVHEAASLAAILPNPRKLSPTSMVQSTRRRYLRIMREYQATRIP